MCRYSLLPALAVGLCLSTGSLAQEASCPTPASTFELIQAAIFERGCTQSYCHGEARVYGLDLRPQKAYDSARAFVEPGQPERSSLWYVLAKKTLGPDLPSWLVDLPGEPMPIAALPLSSDQLEAMRLWILAGAPKDGVVDGVADLIDACPPPTPRPGDDALPPPCGPNESDLLLPDLVIDPPGQVRVLYRGTNRIISFNTEIGNTGAGPLIIQAGSRPGAPGSSVDAMQIIHKRDGSMCSRPAGTAFYKYQGKEWSYADIAYFELRKDDPNTGEVVARRFKDYYCLADTDPIRGWEEAPHQYEMHCEDLIGRMGISVGYKDMYHRVHPGQWIDLDEDPTTPIEAGTYYLVQVVDENNFLLETDDSRQSNANYTTVAVTFPDPDGPSVRQTPVPSTARSTPSVTPMPTRPARPGRPVRPPRPTRPARLTEPTPTATSGRGSSVVEFDNEGMREVGPVEFSHLEHKGAFGQEKLDCKPCHVGPPPLFEMRARVAGEARYTMEEMRQGRACGHCHDGETAINGTVVFAVSGEGSCRKCHAQTVSPQRPARPTRPPRPPRQPRPGEVSAATTPASPSTVPTPTPTLRAAEQPERPLRPTRLPRPTRAPRPGSVPPTPTAQRPVSTNIPSGNPCAHACPYRLSQVRLTWYDHLGLSLSLQVGGDCPPLTPSAGEPVSVSMTNWVATSGVGTAHQYSASLTLSGDNSAVSGARSLRLEAIGDGTRITYMSSEPALARADDGDEFPVAFDLCVTIGDQAVAASLACQPKNTGLLCHRL